MSELVCEESHKANNDLREAPPLLPIVAGGVLNYMVRS